MPVRIYYIWKPIHWQQGMEKKAKKAVDFFKSAWYNLKLSRDILTLEWIWANSSAGRAPALQAGGHRFEPCFAHHTSFLR